MKFCIFVRLVIFTLQLLCIALLDYICSMSGEIDK